MPDPQKNPRTDPSTAVDRDREDINRNPDHDEWDQNEPSVDQVDRSGDEEQDNPRPGEKPIHRDNEMPIRRTNEHDYDRDQETISDDVGNEGGGR